MSQSENSSNRTDGAETTRRSVIEIDDVRKEYPGVVANDDISLDIQEGEFFTLLGPSGSGKSTLLQIITGTNTPTSGDVYISGERVNDVKPYNRSTSLIFQEYALFPHMTARENVEYGLMIQGVAEERRHSRSEEMFELMGLQGKEDRKISELSGGERQRVAMARSLIIEPDVLLLDEVLSALDVNLAKEMQVELKRLQEQIDKTFVFVTHSQEEAFTMSDRIAIMNEGEVVQIGPPLEVYQNPNSEFVADFLGVSNVFSGIVTSAEEETLTVDTGAYTFTIADEEGAKDVGDEVGFIVANERLELGNEGENRLEGTIRDTIFKGPSTEYTVQLNESAKELTIHESTGEALYDENTSVTVSFDPGSAKLLKQ
jgi:ABC-type Fe3+/spermidine/putrescine transport system ATPase subunit